MIILVCIISSQLYRLPTSTNLGYEANYLNSQFLAYLSYKSRTHANILWGCTTNLSVYINVHVEYDEIVQQATLLRVIVATR